MKKKQISLQVYSARNFKPYEDIFKFLSEEGMKNVELFEVEAFNETKELLDKYNLISLSSHIGFDTLKNTDLIIESLKKIKNQSMPSYLAQLENQVENSRQFLNKNEEEWDAFGKELSSYVQVFEDKWDDAWIS